MGNILFWTSILLYLGAVITITLCVRSRTDDAEYFFASGHLNALQAFLSVVSSETSVGKSLVGVRFF